MSETNLEALNGKALMAVFDFMSATHVTAGYLEFEVNQKPLADQLNQARLQVEPSACALYKQMDDDGMAILDPDSGEPSTFDKIGHDYHNYLYGFSTDNSYLAQGEPLESFNSVIKSLDEAIQFSLVAMREALNTSAEAYIPLYRRLIMHTLQVREVLGFVLTTVPSPTSVVFIPENFEELNAPLCITEMKEADGLAVKFPIPFQGQLFHPNSDGKLPSGPATIEGVGGGIILSVASIKDVTMLTQIYADTAMKWANGLN